MEFLSWTTFLRSHYIEGFPRLLFTSGIAKLTNEKADDKDGILFCLVVALLQEETQEFLLTEHDVSKIFLPQNSKPYPFVIISLSLFMKTR